MDEIIVNLEQGALKGKTQVDYNGKDFCAFLGIPYAKPPVGDLRFRAPKHPDSWSGVRDATKDGNACYAKSIITQATSGSEDCLFLNVYTPSLPQIDSDLKAVMVWIHGGAFTEGSNSSTNYGPEYLMTEDVVIVAINYRLGVLGFFSLEDPELGVPGNAGMKDMIMALTWIQKNISKFGGDPNNVTIFGESAGGAAVHLLVLSPMAKGLFHKAIAQSGSAYNPWVLGKSPAQELATVTNCPHKNEKDILQYLQELPVDKLLEAQDQITSIEFTNFTPHVVRSVGPIIEKPSPSEPAFLDEHPLTIISQGKANKVPLIMGYTSHEGLVFGILKRESSHQDFTVDFEEYVPNYFSIKKGSLLSKFIGDKIKNFYFDGETPSSRNKEKLFPLLGDTIFIHGIYSSAQDHALTQEEPVFLYRFSVDAKLNAVKKLTELNLPGASHGDDLGYLFKSGVPQTVELNSIEDKTIRRIVKLWTNFAKTGNPNPVDSVTWRPVTKDRLHFLDIDHKLIRSLNPDQRRMQFWDDIIKYQIRQNLKSM